MRTIEPFEGDDVRAIPLIPIGRYIVPGTIGTIAGWGIVVNKCSTNIITFSHKLYIFTMSVFCVS